MNPFAAMFSLTLFLLASGAGPSFAAEIININYKYRIAFTDLTQNEVKEGDLVYVLSSDGTKTRLKVLETFPVMTKLSVPDGEVLTDQQFAALSVGNKIILEKGNSDKRPPVSVQEPALKPNISGGQDDGLAHVEKYSPGAAGAETKENMVVFPTEKVPVDAADLRARAEILEQRLDQMMANNVKLTETVTQLLADKNAAEGVARTREADVLAARKRANEFSDANAELRERVQELEDAAMSFEQIKAAQQKEIESLNIKLGELKKKLAKMVEIVNTNMKAYEK